jgi:hypothetical protein
VRVALITASYGDYDPVRDLPEWHGFDEAVCVTDRADLVGDGWSPFVEWRGCCVSNRRTIEPKRW